MKRQTAQRRAILDTLAHAPGSLTPQEVLDAARSVHAGFGDGLPQFRYGCR